MKTKTYSCSDCFVCFQIVIVPNPDHPAIIVDVSLIPEVCPFCGESKPFNEVREE